jgi:fructokinase
LFDCIANDDARGWSVETMVENNAWTAFPGGAPANVATACCKLGTSSSFVGCVGLDEDGDKLENLFRDIGVDVTLLQRAKEDDAPTRRVMVTRSLEGDREFGGFYGGRSADEFADCQLDSSLLFRHDDDENHRGAAIIDGASWLVCSTLSLAFEKSADAIYKCIDRGLESGARLYVDINWRPVFWPPTGEIAAREEIISLARRAHIVKMTDEEAEWLLGVPASEALSDPARIHDEFPKALGVFVTAGEKGASYSMLGDTGLVEPFQVNVRETTGAGDAFTAGILHSLLNLGIDLDSFDAKVPRHRRPAVVNQFVRFAAAVGALTCTKEGAIAAQPTISEVENLLSRKEQVSL